MGIDYRNELNEEQYKAVTTTEGPVLILAGAGSGKTRTLIYRVSYLVENGVSPENILLLTFTNKAANEMKERAVNMLDSRCGDITACTYHSFCTKILRRYGKAIGLSNNYTIIDQADASSIISMLKTEEGYNKMSGFPKSDLIVGMISAAANMNISLADAVERSGKAKGDKDKYMAFISEIQTLSEKFADYKLKNKVVDYDDLLVYTLKLFNEHKDIAKKVSDTYRYIMVDEYQDTNYLQEQIVFALRTDNRNLAVVGDDSQSIYAFRGSDVTNILSFPKKMEGCQIVYLTTNYRSNQEIMDLSNHIMKAHATEGYAKELKATWNKDALPTLAYVEDAFSEAEYIVSEIMRLHEKGVKYSDICVLIRNSAQSYRLEPMLLNMEIPFDKFGGTKFMEKGHIKDVLSYLRCIVNSRDEIAWYRILQLHQGIGKANSRKIAALCKDNGKNGLMTPAVQKRKYSKELTMLSEFFDTIMPMDLDAMIDQIIEFYHNLCKENILNMNTDESKRSELLEENEEHLQDLNVLASMVKRYTNPVDFLDDVTLEMQTKNTEGEDDRLVISTIHSAKGLEFDTVFIMDCVDGMCPATDVEKEGSPEDNEELRCFYVAVTRTKNRLYLLVPFTATRFGQPFSGTLSHFLSEADDLLSVDSSHGFRSYMAS